MSSGPSPAYSPDNCPCKRFKCERYADCGSCRAYHSASARQPLTACERAAKKAAESRAKSGVEH